METDWFPLQSVELSSVFFFWVIILMKEIQIAILKQPLAFTAMIGAGSSQEGQGASPHSGIRTYPS